MELIYVTLFVCYAGYAYNRKSVSFAVPKMLQQGLDASDAGLISSCQNAAFGISKFFAGVLSDQVNPLLLFSSGLLVSGIATILFSHSSSTAVFCGLWFVNGLAQGCGWPACAKIIRQRATPSQFGTLWSVLSSSYNLAGGFCPFISAFIILNFGWRWSVFTAGIVSIVLWVLALLSLAVSSKTSSKPTEKEKVPTKQEDQNFEKKVGIYDLLFDPFIWQLSACYLMAFCAKTTTTDWGQIYLMEEKKQTQYVASAFTSSVEGGGLIGRILAGCLTDRMVKRAARSTTGIQQSKPNLRMSLAILFVFGSCVSLQLFRTFVTEESSTAFVVFCGMLIGTCYYGPVSIYGIVSMECVPLYLSGTSNAIASSAGIFGAILSGLPVSYLAKSYGWSKVFLMLEVALGITVFGMHFCRKLEPRFMERKKEE